MIWIVGLFLWAFFAFFGALLWHLLKKDQYL